MREALDVLLVVGGLLLLTIVVTAAERAIACGLALCGAGESADLLAALMLLVVETGFVIVLLWRWKP